MAWGVYPHLPVQFRIAVHLEEAVRGERVSYNRQNREVVVINFKLSLVLNMFRHKYPLEARVVIFLNRFLRLSARLLLFRILALVAVLVRVIILAHNTS